jgi:hypothetical protein
MKTKKTKTTKQPYSKPALTPFGAVEKVTLVGSQEPPA